MLCALLHAYTHACIYNTNSVHDRQIETTNRTKNKKKTNKHDVEFIFGQFYRKNHKRVRSLDRTHRTVQHQQQRLRTKLYRCISIFGGNLCYLICVCVRAWKATTRKKITTIYCGQNNEKNEASKKRTLQTHPK